jgi:D-arabinose 1-dehydrogenase-like Zn-dependent alcohol dehydrogenase
VRAALITGTEQLEILDFPDPVPTDAGLVVDVTFCGVCGTDVQAFTSGRAYTPAVCGHEWTGVVSAVGRSVSRFAEGDRVVVGVPRPVDRAPPVGRVRTRTASPLTHSPAAAILTHPHTAVSPPGSR